MNEHSRRVLRRAVNLLEQYRAGQVSLRSLVGGLEGSLTSLEESLPDDFYAGWRTHWDELEVVLATGGYQERNQEILKEVGALEALILEYI